MLPQASDRRRKPEIRGENFYFQPILCVFVCVFLDNRENEDSRTYF